MKTFIKLLIVYGRLNAMVLLVLSFKYMMDHNIIPAIADFILAAWLMFLEANYIVNHIEDGNQHKQV